MKPARRPSSLVAIKSPPRALLPDLRQMILTAREQVARAIDGRLTQLYWEIGRRIRQDILGAQRAAYGEKIVSALGRQLSVEFGAGFDEKSLRHMIRFAEIFPDAGIVSALRRQLSWTHFKHLIYLPEVAATRLLRRAVPGRALDHAYVG